MTLVVNLFGAPCAGKSTMAAGLFYCLKRAGVRAELAGEYAKDLTYDARFEGAASLRDQIYIFAKQRSRIERLVPHCEVIITDCPVLLGASYYPELFPDSFRELLVWAFNEHDTMNFFLNREHAYSTHGRRQTEEESDQIAKEMMEFLDSNGVIYQETTGSDGGLEAALHAIHSKLGTPDRFYETIKKLALPEPYKSADACWVCEGVGNNCTCDPFGC
jgi:hypothetical protein